MDNEKTDLQEDRFDFDLDDHSNDGGMSVTDDVADSNCNGTSYVAELGFYCAH